MKNFYMSFPLKENGMMNNPKFKCHSPTSKPMDNYIQFLSLNCMATYHSLTPPWPPPLTKHHCKYVVVTNLSRLISLT